MKTNDIFILIATAAYSYLFYEQSAGINYLVFNVLIVLLLFAKDTNLVLKPAWLAIAAGSLISSFFVFWWGTTLPWVANLCSLFALAGLSFNAESSLLLAALNTFISVNTSIPRFFSSSVRMTKPENGSTSTFTRILLFAGPVFITFIFVFVYRAANPIFEKFTDKISLDFISFNWCVFTLIGFFMMYGFFKFFIIQKLNEADNLAHDNLPFLTLEQHQQSDLGKKLPVRSEVFTGVVLFVLLNMVLFCVNGLDIFYMWIVNRLPSGITIAEYLHDGADTLILSIIMAIAVILFVFRGYLNFFRSNYLLKVLAYAWIAQNALLVITTANRNWWIIESTGLTRRRIGVYVYLLLCLIGLTTIFIKVMGKKSNWFLFRKNAWGFYAVFIVACFINWDELIVNYNYKHYKALELEYIDRNYQAELSHTCLATLFTDYADEKKEPNAHNPVFTKRVISSMYAGYDDLKKRAERPGWQSFCISRYNNLNAINQMINNGEVPAHE